MAARPPESASARCVGILCGSGLLPLRVAESLSGSGARVVAIGIEGEADPAIEEAAAEVHWTGLAKLGHWVSILRKAGAGEMLMCGAIRKGRMFASKAAMLPDWRTVKLWYGRLASKGDHTILGALVEEFEKEGIRVRSVPECCPELMAPAGCLTRRSPGRQQWRDIRFAWPIVKQAFLAQAEGDLEGGRLVAIERCFSRFGQRITQQSEAGCSWELVSAGRVVRDPFGMTQAIIAEIEGTPATRIHLNIDGVPIHLTLGDLLAGGRLIPLLDESRRCVLDTFGLDENAIGNPDDYFHNARKVKIHRAVPEAAWRVRHTFRAIPLLPGPNALYVRVSQTNDQYAWSSPIWVEAPS